MIRNDFHKDRGFLFAEYNEIVRRFLTGTRNQYPVGSQERTGLGDLLRTWILPLAFEIAQLAKRTDVKSDGCQRIEVGKSYDCPQGNAQFEQLVTNL